MNIDLNILNYNLREIEEFFHLTLPYTLNDVLKCEKQILQVIIQDDKYNIEKKNEFIELMLIKLVGIGLHWIALISK